MTKSELTKELQVIQKQLSNPNTPDAAKASLKIAMDNITKQLQDIESQERQASTAAAQATQQQATSAQPVQPYLTNLVTAMEQVIKNKGQGGASVDPAELKRMIDEQIKQSAGDFSFEKLKPFIEAYLQTERKIELTLPQYGVSVKVTDDMAMIPNFFKVMDDVLVGNNVYLIGEAGTGKTYLAEAIAKALSRQKYVVNCSQYTTPIDIMGGQTISGYKAGALLSSWENGGILILDEMPKLDPNTAGLFNDALSKATKTIPKQNATISDPRKGGEPIQRSDLFACIATGNIYPNKVDLARYVGNNQQDLSLLDRFSGGVYFVGYDDVQSAFIARYQFIYDLLVGNKTGAKQGLRYYMLEKGYNSYAVVSLRTIISVRVSFEIELQREIQLRQNPEIEVANGKTFADAIESYLVAFNSNPVVKTDLINKFNLTPDNLKAMAKKAIDQVIDKNWGMVLTPQFYRGGKDTVVIEELTNMTMVKNAVTTTDNVATANAENKG